MKTQPWSNNREKSSLRLLIEAFEELFSGFSWKEIGENWKDFYNDISGSYDPLNPLEYE